jgi:hypothetical protein
MPRPRGPTRDHLVLTHIRVSQRTKELVLKLKATNETVDECIYRLVVDKISMQEANSIPNNKKEDIVKRETQSRILDRVAKEVGKRYMTRLNRRLRKTETRKE